MAGGGGPAGALRRPDRWAGHAFTVLFVGAWAAYAATIPSYVLPGPAEVAVRFAEFMGDPVLVGHMLISFAHIAAAIALSFVIGFALALLPYYLPVFRLMVHGRITPFLNSFSGIGWTLLAVLWFGLNHFSVVFVICAVLVPFAIVNMREGLETLDAELLEMSRSFTRSRLRTFRRVVVPSLYPFMFATLRISFGVSWKVALTAELFGGNAGLGYLFNLARQEFDTALILVVIVIIIVFVYSVDRYVFGPIQARLSRQYGAA